MRLAVALRPLAGTLGSTPEPQPPNLSNNYVPEDSGVRLAADLHLAGLEQYRTRA